MAINRVEIKDFLVFKGEFAADFCEGINVLIGGNGTGKTTLLRCLYKQQGRGVFVTVKEKIERYVYIPEKDILEHAKGLLTFIEHKPTGFNEIYKDVLVSAQDIPTTIQSETQKKIGDTISNIIGGHVEWEHGDGSFYTVRTDGKRIPFASEASGFKKLGFLGLLVMSGQLEPGTILFWDEPENSINPEQVPIFVDILLELSRNRVQIFLATHSEILASYINALHKNNDKVMFFSLYKDDDIIKYDKDERFDLLKPNSIIAEQAKLYEKEIERVLR